MAGGRQNPIIVHLTPTERAALRRLDKSRTIPAGLARHVRMVLLRADGLSITAIAYATGVARRHVARWLIAYQTQGLAGLSEPRRCGRPRKAVSV